MAVVELMRETKMSKEEQNMIQSVENEEQEVRVCQLFNTLFSFDEQEVTVSELFNTLFFTQQQEEEQEESKSIIQHSVLHSTTRRRTRSESK